MQKPKEDLKKIGIAIFIALLIFAFSFSIFNFIQASLLGLVAFMVVLWTNEGLPLGVVSLLPIVLFPSFSILDTTQTTLNYANPIIFLFFGGFLLAVAVEKTELHRWITNKMFTVFPSTPKGIIFSLVITSGLLSSLLSNTTTTLLLMSIALFITEDTRLKMRFALAIAYGASVGGILTPIGTPPNLILLGFMQKSGIEAISFLQWMLMVAPLVFMMFFVVASLLSIGVKDITITLDSQKKELSIEQKKVLFLIGGVILLLLLNASFKPYWSGLGLNENGILLSAGLLLFAPPLSILEWMDDKAKIPFRIMFLFGAGFSIATAFSATGLADEVASYLIVMTQFHPILIILSVAMLITFTTEITSNTALISVMLPVIYAVSQQSGLNASLFMMVAAVCASYAFMLPIATPPNAIAMSSGAVSVKDMARYGIILNFIGISLVVIIAEFFWKGFF
ncbi:DASS family sodium-coupled anion symporter [Sulfurimonas sp.]|jgi:sodium-dependent dicarboxylate transporter 2/3/5|uniref:SLC13 family permease n=1 Tax=Sulfurimonas sp. TaxID=2022749 RepID=UPI0025F7C135|nr:DASS family sodium-coupled anion symporter [Sulfurimonas sp.]MCK9473106.1 DASS family sodium-coupled anion symporter [Sulfurimonas sp.]